MYVYLLQKLCMCILFTETLYVYIVLAIQVSLQKLSTNVTLCASTQSMVSK